MSKQTINRVNESSVSSPANGWAAILSAVAVIGVGYAIHINNGALAPDALLWITISLLSLLAAVAFQLTLKGRVLQEDTVLVLMSGGILFSLMKLFTRAPGIYLRLSGPSDIIPFFVGLAALCFLAAAGLSKKPLLGRARMPLFLVVHFLMGIWLIRSAPNPDIDVFIFQRDSSVALLNGINPYTITFPDIYGNSSPFYGQGMSVNGRLTFGFPYFPWSLLMALPGHIIAGDYRYSCLAAITGAGALFAYARPSRVSMTAAALFLLTPRTFFVLEQGWTEPFVILTLAAIVFVAFRSPSFLPYAFGLFLATKQYLVFAVPMAWMLWPRPLPSRRDLLLWSAKAVGVAALVTLPFVLWDFSAFMHDVVMLQILQPFRAEALSYLAWYAQDGGERLPTALAFIAALAALGICLWRAPKTPTGFALSVALTFCAFFAFNKQAFCNYYYFIVGASAAALATAFPSSAAVESAAGEFANAKTTTSSNRKSSRRRVAARA